MKTIMHVAEAFGGGIVTFLANLANQQVEHYNVIIVHGIRPETHKNYKDFFDSRVKFVHVKSFQQRIHLSSEIKALNELRQLIKEYNPDVIHMHSSQAGVLGKIAAIGHNCSKAYSPHGFSFLREDAPTWKRSIFKLIERCFSLFNCAMVASSASEFRVAQKLTNKSILIMNGIGSDSLKPFEGIKPNNKVPVVGMVGRALYQKNPTMFNEIAEKMPNIHFEWIGDGVMRNVLKSSNIHIVGWGPREEALEYVANCDIYIMTSLWEGMPISLLEAMYMHKPCVVTNVVGNRDVINNDKNGFVCNTVDEFVEKIQYLVDNPELRTQLGEQGHNDVENIYNSRVMAVHYTDAYNSSMDAIKEWHKRDTTTYCSK
jgi:glycosyltransferase involved in cell wall biosynthesis